MNSTQETGRDLQLRAQLYRWLSNCYVREVDQSTLSNYLGKEGEIFLHGLSRISHTVNHLLVSNEFARGTMGSL